MARPTLVALPGMEGAAQTFEGPPGRVRAWALLPMDLPTEGRDMEGWARAALKDPALPDRFALLGASLGGLIAWQMALLAPERVQALVTVGSLPDPRFRPCHR